MLDSCLSNVQATAHGGDGSFAGSDAVRRLSRGSSNASMFNSQPTGGGTAKAESEPSTDDWPFSPLFKVSRFQAHSVQQVSTFTTSNNCTALVCRSPICLKVTVVNLVCSNECSIPP